MSTTPRHCHYCYVCEKEFSSSYTLNKHLEGAGLSHQLRHLQKREEINNQQCTIAVASQNHDVLEQPTHGREEDETSEGNNCIMDATSSNDADEGEGEDEEGQEEKQSDDINQTEEQQFSSNISVSFSGLDGITNEVQDENLDDSDHDSRVNVVNNNNGDICDDDNDSFCSSTDQAPAPGKDVSGWTNEVGEEEEEEEEEIIPAFNLFEEIAMRAQNIQNQQQQNTANEEKADNDSERSKTPASRSVFAARNGHEIPCNYDLHNKWQTKKKKGGYVDASISKDDQCYLELLDLLFAAKAPNYLFDKIVTWARNSVSRGAFVEANPVPTRVSLIKKFSLYTGLEDYNPIKETIKLPNAKINLEYVRFDPIEAVISLMTDKYLWQPEKLDTFERGDDGSYWSKGGVFASPQYKGSKLDQNGLPEIPKDHVLRDFFSGHLNQMVYWQKISVKGEELVIPLVCFMDKTHIDRHGRLCQEPFCITLGIFNRQTRADPRAWRVIGYIPNQTMHVTAKDPVRKLDDYHFILRHILSPLADTVTNKGGIYWEFPANVVDNNGKKKEGLVHFYFSCLLGDNEGHDKACNHYGNRTSKCPCLCRRCDTPFKETDNPYYRYKTLKKGTQIENYNKSSKSQTGKLICNDYGFHRLPNGNAFHEAHLDMGIPTHISTRCAIDLMHTLLKGLLTMVIDGFRTLERKKVLIESDLVQIAVGGDDDDDDDIVLLSETDPTKAGASKKARKRYHIFSKTIKAVVEKALTIWGVLLKQQSDRDLPRTYFPQGALSTEKLNCHEYVGILILYDLFVLSTLGDQMLGTVSKTKRELSYTSHGWIGADEQTSWVKAMEELLILNEFLRQPHMLVADVFSLKEYMTHFLDDMRHTINRKEGNGMKTVKFHLMLHFWEDIIKFGVPANTDTEAGESNHKFIVKRTAERTQMRSKFLDWQAAHRYMENLIITNMSTIVVSRQNSSAPVASVTIGDLNTGQAAPPKNLIRGWSLCFDNRNIYHVPKTKKEQDNPRPASFLDEGGRLLLFNDLKRLLTKTVSPECQYRSAKYLYMFNQITIDGIIYRASPCRSSTRQLNVGWNDWAYASWGNASLIRMEKVNRTRDGLPQKGGGTTGEYVDFGNEDYPAQPDMIVPVHLLCFVRIDGSANGFLHCGRHISDGNYAVCHAVTQKEPTHCEGSIIVKDAMKDKKTDNYSVSNDMIMYLIPVENIRKPCICVPNIRGPQKKWDLAITDAVPHRVDHLLVVPRSTWPNIFVQRMKERNEEGKKQRLVTWETHNNKKDDSDGSALDALEVGRAGSRRRKSKSRKKPTKGATSKAATNKVTAVGNKKRMTKPTSQSKDASPDSTDSDKSSDEEALSNYAKRKRGYPLGPSPK